MPDVRVGFIGLGIMGRPMALTLLRAGCPLVVHNRTRDKEKEIVAEVPSRRRSRARWRRAPRS
jgi:3-hydroxyisobutyrate dehydrogenase-like beta-hydroxyacid dehydrogenase